MNGLDDSTRREIDKIVERILRDLVLVRRDYLAALPAYQAPAGFWGPFDMPGVPIPLPGPRPPGPISPAEVLRHLLCGVGINRR
jgi:hypothetical protein